MDEPTESQRLPSAEQTAEPLLPTPISARSTEHPWEEPAILPAPGMFTGPATGPVRARHRRRRRPLAVIGGAAAAALVLGSSAIALTQLAHDSGPTGRHGGAAAALPQAGEQAAAGSTGGGDTGSGSGRPAADDLVNARAVQSAAPTTAAFGSAAGSTSALTAGGYTSGPAPAITAQRRAPAPVTSYAPSPSSSLPRSTGVPTRGSLGGPHTPGTVPVPTGSGSAPSAAPHPNPRPKPTHSHLPTPSEEPSPSQPSEEPPSRSPSPRPTHSHAAPPPSTEPAEPTERPTERPTARPPVEKPIPVPSRSDPGLHKAIGHAVDTVGQALGHDKSPARPDATPIPGPIRTTAQPSPTTSAAE